jgi:hypothetical protein
MMTHDEHQEFIKYEMHSGGYHYNYRSMLWEHESDGTVLPSDVVQDIYRDVEPKETFWMSYHTCVYCGGRKRAYLTTTEGEFIKCRNERACTETIQDQAYDYDEQAWDLMMENRAYDAETRHSRHDC